MTVPCCSPALWGTVFRVGPVPGAPNVAVEPRDGVQKVLRRIASQTYPPPKASPPSGEHNLPTQKT